MRQRGRDQPSGEPPWEMQVWTLREPTPHWSGEAIVFVLEGTKPAYSDGSAPLYYDRASGLVRTLHRAGR